MPLDDEQVDVDDAKQILEEYEVQLSLAIDHYLTGNGLSRHILPLNKILTAHYTSMIEQLDAEIE